MPDPNPNAQNNSDQTTEAAKTAAALAHQQLGKLLEAQGLKVVEQDDGKGGKTQVLAKDIKVSGETVTKLITEMVKDSEKVGGADKAFRDAKDATTKAEKATQVLGLLEAAKDESKPAEERVAAVREVAILMGDNPAQVDSIFNSMQKPASGTEGGDTTAGAGAETTAPDPNAIKLSDLPPDLQAVVKDERELAALPASVKEYVIKNRDRDRLERRDKIHEVTKISVDEDPVIGKLEGDAKDHLHKLAKKEVQRRVVVLGEEFNAELLTGVLQELRPLAEMLGKKGSSEGGTDEEAALRRRAELAAMYPELASLPGGLEMASDIAQSQAGSQSGDQATSDKDEPKITEAGWTEAVMDKVRKTFRRLREQDKASALNR